MKTSAKPPLVIHIFSPLSDQLPSGCFVARVSGRERVRARSRLAQRVGADRSRPRRDRGRYFAFCASVPKSTIGRIVRFACAPIRGAKRRRARDALGDDERRDLVEIEAAVLPPAR